MRRRPRIRRRGRALAIAASAVIAAAAFALALRPPGRGPIERAPATASPPASAPTPSATPRADVELSITTEPPGADVYTALDGLLVGRTPLTVHVPRQEARAVYRLRKDGFVEVRVELPADRDGAAHVSLAPVPAAERNRPPRDRPPGARPARGAGSGKGTGTEDLEDPFGGKP
jgi:hypothetical protein